MTLKVPGTTDGNRPGRSAGNRPVRAILPALLAALTGTATPLGAQGVTTAAHTQPAPILSREDAATQAATGITLERDRDAGWLLAEHRRLDAALAKLSPQRAGRVDAYVVVAGLDSDAVFGREARQVAAVLSRRYDAAGRTIVLAGGDGRTANALAMGTPATLSIALARVAEVMDRDQDVLILYTTSHGAPWGLYYNDGDQGYGAIAPARLWHQLSTLGIRNRLLLISACFSGAFVPMLASDTTAIVTASSADRTSFGCRSDNDWTFFGDALVNHALRQPQPLAKAADAAFAAIAGWERDGDLKPSQPQLSIGAGAARWLATLESHLPAATAPVGQPAIVALQK